MEIPSKLLFSLESVRGLYEYGLGWALSSPMKTIVPAGDKHPVMVIPGLGTSDESTHFLRKFVESIGYSSYSWGMGRNLGPRQGLYKMLADIYERMNLIYVNEGNKEISLIGWSLGGIYARELAKMNPEMVRQVITLGTPFKGEAAKTNAEFLYELLSGDKSHKDPQILKRVAEPPPVPFTSLYSKTDGVVHWKCSIENESHLHENVEIPGSSHIGMGHNPIAMYVIADRLNQKKETWKKYKNG